ncbi:hypothetical protein ElyMa_005147000 [Elysia marginata]|uniref:Uncharacterized protein n=1 Tax=Elysia marginata TaxID=1093978 RepID=A0AAV4JMS8_9GAST|nr:hypothetical protein ElyMa_005147000 [Elysia marginata]
MTQFTISEHPSELFSERVSKVPSATIPMPGVSKTTIGSIQASLPEIARKSRSKSLMRKSSSTVRKIESSAYIEDRKSSGGSVDGGAVTLSNSKNSGVNKKVLSATPSAPSAVGVAETVQRRSKIVGTNIPLTMETIFGETSSSLPASTSNVNNSAKDKDWPASATDAKPAATDGKGPGRRATGVPAGTGATGRGVTVSPSHRSSVAHHSKYEPPRLDRFSQWTQKALLTVTDVAGVEWLDYNDGSYNPPLEDTSLLSLYVSQVMDRLCGLAIKTLTQRSGGTSSIPVRVKPRSLKFGLAADPPSVWHCGFSAKSGRPGVRIM